MKIDGKAAMVWFIALIMIGSTIGYVFLSGYGDSGNTLKYGAYTFERTPDGLRTRIGGQDYWFLYFPSEVADINLSREAAAKIRDARVAYVTSDLASENREFIGSASYALGFAMQQRNIILVTGFTNSTVAPIVTCANATPFVPVMFFEDANQTIVELDGNCVRLKAARGEDFLRGKDRLLYGIMGIMENG